MAADEQEPSVGKPKDLGQLKKGEPDQVGLEEFIITETTVIVPEQAK